MIRPMVLLLAGCSLTAPDTLPRPSLAGGDTGGALLPDTGGWDTSIFGGTAHSGITRPGDVFATGDSSPFPPVETGLFPPTESESGLPGETGLFPPRESESGLLPETGLFPPMGTGESALPPPDTGGFPPIDSGFTVDSGFESGGWSTSGGDTWIPIPPIDTWTGFETWETGGGGGPDTDPIDTAVATLGPGELNDGDVAITELMLDPGCAGGSWFEIQNRTAQPIRMRDFSFTWAGTAFDIMSTSDFAPVLQVGASMSVHAASGVDCYDAPARLMFAGDLSGAPDILTLRAENRVVSRLDFSAHVFPAGQSLGLHPDTRIVDGQEGRPGYWCPQSGVLTPTSDEGTPNEVNTPCAWATEGTPPSALVAGDLMITEMLPQSADCTSTLNGVYLEVFNTTASPIRVPGINVEFRGDLRPVRLLDGPPLLPPGEFASLALADIDARCPYTLSTEYDLIAPTPASTEAVILRAGSTVIDDVGVPAAVVQSGLALQLDPAVVLTGDMSENDDPNLWCVGGPVLPGATQDRGTPGQVNDCSMPDPPDTDDTDDTVEPPDTDTVIDTDDTVIDTEIDPPVDTDELGGGGSGSGKTCGCAAGGGPTMWWMLTLVLLVRRRR